MIARAIAAPVVDAAARFFDAATDSSTPRDGDGRFA
jgi:hypothetical protein